MNAENLKTRLEPVVNLACPAETPLENAASLAKPADYALYLLLLAAGYFLAARLGLGFRFQNSNIGVVWPANAVLVSALLLSPRRTWWIFLTVAGLAHVLAVGPTAPAWRLTWQIAANSIFAVATVEAVRRFALLPLDFGTRRQVIAFTSICLAVPALWSLTTATFVRSLVGLETMPPAFALLRTSFSNSTALLVVVPAVLLWAQHGFRRARAVRPARLFEAVLLSISLLLAGLVALATSHEIARLPGLRLLVFPPLLWAALRFGPLGASTSLFFIAALSMFAAAAQLGPFVLVPDVDQVLSLQLFWLVLCPPVTLLAASIHEREVTEAALHQQSNQLAHINRLATAGEFSAALSHELRQPVASILINAEAASGLLAGHPPNLAQLREILNDIANQAAQTGDIISRVRSFAKKEQPKFQTFALETVMRDALALARSAVAMSHVEVQTEIPDGLPPVYGDPVQLLQVVLNLIMNACESMSSIPASERHLRLQIRTTSGQQQELCVIDSGVGLPSEQKNRLFEPFFTTKEKGLGLGLTICRSIATAHGGKLWAENNPHRGATFHLTLPSKA